MELGLAFPRVTMIVAGTVVSALLGWGAARLRPPTFQSTVQISGDHRSIAPSSDVLSDKVLARTLALLDDADLRQSWRGNAKTESNAVDNQDGFTPNIDAKADAILQHDADRVGNF